MDQNLVDLKYSGFEEVTIGEFFGETYQVFYYELDLDKDLGYKSCDDVELVLTYQFQQNFTFTASSSTDFTSVIWCYYVPKESPEYQAFIDTISHLKAIETIDINRNVDSIKLNLFYEVQTKIPQLT